MKSTCLSIAVLLISTVVAAGQPSGPKIVGGSEIGRNEFPFAAWVKFRMFRDSPHCTGSVIAPRWVLTAAHCLEAEGGDILPAFTFEVLVGRDFSQAVPILVQRVIVHPDYRNPVIYPDTALLELSQPVSVEPVGLLDLEGEALHASPGTQAVLIGGGFIEGGEAAGVLRKASFTISSDCPLRLVTESAMCIDIVTGKEPKEGDSGGPLVVRLPDGKWAQAGITKASAATDFAPLTRVASIHDWIDGHVPLDETTTPPVGPTTPPSGRLPTAEGTITTYAGTGESGCCRDGGRAVFGQLRFPFGVAVDGEGNLYIADRSNHMIRKVDSSGVIDTVTGTGVGGYRGDGGAAGMARLRQPTGVAVDGEGNLYIADKDNHRIRKVDSDGVITTVAGTGERGSGGDGGPAVHARLAVPTGVAVDGEGNLFIADAANQQIRKVDTSGVITAVAGSGESGFGGDGGPATEARLRSPFGVAVDGAGNLFIADSYNHRVRKVDSSGIITTVAGMGERGFSGDDGPAVQAQLAIPHDVAVDDDGNLFVVDTSNQRIRKVDSSGTITTIAGTGERGYSGDGGPAVSARLHYPTGATLDGAGNLFIADKDNHRIRVVKIKLLTEPPSPPVGPTTPPTGPQPTADGPITTLSGTGEYGYGGDGGPAGDAQLKNPHGVAADGSGNVYIADTFNYRIRKVDSSGVITTVAGTGESGFSGDGGPSARARLGAPWDVATDGSGNIYFSDYSNNRIRKVDSSGVISTIAGTGRRGFGGDGGQAVRAQLSLPRGVAVDRAGNLYIADYDNLRIRKVDTSGVISTVAGTGELGSPQRVNGDGGQAVLAQLRNAHGVATDNEGNLYIADTEGNRIRKVDTSGIITTVAGLAIATRGGRYSGDGGAATAATLNHPTNVATDDAGNLYIVDSYNHRIRKVDTSGIITTIAGTGESGDEGDGGRAGEGRLNYPRGVAVDGAGNLYIADTANNRIRVVKPESLLTGDRIYYFPHLAVGASWQTTITYINYSPEEVSCQTDFLSDLGDPLMISFPGRGMVSSRTDVLPPGGSVHEETDVGLSAPLAAGWARATCSGPVKASLLFRQHDSAGVPLAEAGVNATPVPAKRFITFAEQTPGQAGTGVAYANPSSTEALITFTAKDAAGQTLATEDLTVLPEGHGAQNMASLFGLGSFSGSLEINSTAPIVSLSLNAEAPPIFSSLPPGEPDAAAQGPTTYYFPHLAVGASWQTTITYINDSSREVTCETEFISDHGSPLPVSFPGRGTVMNRADVLPPGGSVHEETDVELGAMLVPGWAKAACTGPVKASLLFRQYNSEGKPVAEAGVNAAAVPAKRFVTFAEQAEGMTGTGVAYANPSDTAAHVTFTAKDTEGQVLASVVRTVLPKGHDAQVMSALFGFTSFTGSLEISSTEPIVSLSLNFEAAPVFSSLPPGEVVESAP